MPELCRYDAHRLILYASNAHFSGFFVYLLYACPDKTFNLGPEMLLAYLVLAF